MCKEKKMDELRESVGVSPRGSGLDEVLANLDRVANEALAFGAANSLAVEDWRRFLEERTPEDAASCDDADSTESAASDKVVVERFDDDASDLVSTRSASVAGEDNFVDATLARALLQQVRGGQSGVSLPDFTVVSLAPPAMPQSPREERHLSIMIAGDPLGARDQVWHTISTGTTMLPGIECRFERAQAQCYWCPAVVPGGTPIVVLKHLCTPSGDEQRIQLRIAAACSQCATRRGAVVRRPALMALPRQYIQERLTYHIKMCVAALQPQLAKVEVRVDDSSKACDNCSIELSDESSVWAVISKRVDAPEYKFFVVCSRECRDAMRTIVRSMSDASMSRPRPAVPGSTEKLEVALPLSQQMGGRRRQAPVSLALPAPDDTPAGMWRVLEDDDVREAASSIDPAKTLRGSVVHRCTVRGCSCRDTHRGAAFRELHNKHLGDGRSSSAQVSHVVIELLYRHVRQADLYLVILGGEETALCIQCKRPCTFVCTQCRAVRTCSDTCRQLSTKLHATICRPYSEAWTAFSVV